MAWLLIDTHRPGVFRYGWLAAHVREGIGPASKLLPLLDRLTKKRVPDGICVVAGPGSFTSVRTGVLYANLLSRLWKRPLVGVTVAQAEDVAALERRLVNEELRSATYVAPVYDAEPNITLPA